MVLTVNLLYLFLQRQQPGRQMERHSLLGAIKEEELCIAPLRFTGRVNEGIRCLAEGPVDDFVQLSFRRHRLSR